MEHYGVGANARSVADGDISEKLGAGTDEHPIAEGGMTFDLSSVCPAKCDPVIQHAIVTDLGSLPDDDTHAVINEEATPDGCPWVNLNPGKKPGEL